MTGVQIDDAAPAALDASQANTKASKQRALPTLTRDDVARRITLGQALVLRRDLVLNVTSWMANHPGGALALLHFVGRDGGDEIAAYHSDATLAYMAKFAVGRVDLDPRTGWAPLTPPIALGLVAHPDGVKGHWAREGNVRLARGVLHPASPKEGGVEVVLLTPQQLEPAPDKRVDAEKEYARSKAYHELKKRVTDAGLFRPPDALAGYGEDIARYAVLAIIAGSLWYISEGWLGQMASAAFLGFFWQQLTFLVHDAGHCGVTGDWWWDRVIAMTLADWVGGLSASWWCDNHDIHHLVTNHPEHDPDIQHIPFFAISKDFFSSLWSTYYKRAMVFDAPSRFLLQFQHKLYYLVLSLARFNLYAMSYIYIFGPKPKHDAFWKYEIAGMTFYWVWFGALLRSQSSWQMALGYLLVSHICASPVHVQIVLSHFACSTEDLGPAESFPSRQLRTTMDVVCSEDIEYIHGGLHLQVTHHLFPRLPRHNLRKASLLVKEYCKDNDLKYLEYGWLHGNKQVLATLRDVADQLALLKKVADKEIKERLN
ncbi:hypothetical protein Q8F55_006583 [Vanrija albida]|uniref:Delta 8-(E)-sphingolipid desaturase n=1 Tax=Vanrija albida TaxID=181172 RepID=A0ABR3PXJ2_9TREE